MTRLAIALLALAPIVACIVPPAQNTSAYNHSATYGQPAVSNGQVVINGEPLSVQDAAAAQIPAGRYWYDTRSGLWGFEGGPSLGITQAGLAMGGPLSANASNGNTGVYVNGRNLPTQDVASLQQLVQVPVQPGRYFLDANGNMGYEGGQPLVNLMQVAQARQARSGGGDNFWSRGITNSVGNESNGAGYVCTGGTCATYGM